MTQSQGVQFLRIKGKTVSEMNRLQRAVFLDMSKRIIDRTPVDTGRARSNWQAETGGQIPSGKIPVSGKVSGDAAASRAINSAMGALSEHKSGESLVLVNNLEYIQYLEEGTSKQAPSGMVKVTVAEFTSLVPQLVKAA